MPLLRDRAAPASSVPMLAPQVAGRIELDAGDLQLRGRLRAADSGRCRARPGAPRRRAPAPQRRDQPEGRVAMLDALAHRVDRRIVGLQRVVDEDAALAAQAGGARQRDVRAGCRRPSRPGRPAARLPSCEPHACHVLRRRAIAAGRAHHAERRCRAAPALRAAGAPPAHRAAGSSARRAGARP